MLFAAASPPAGGAPIDQVAIATGFATVTTAVLLWLLQGHRSGRSSILGRVAAFSARVGRIPSWAAPSAQCVSRWVRCGANTVASPAVETVSSSSDADAIGPASVTLTW